MSTICNEKQCDPRKERRWIYKLGTPGKQCFCNECYEKERNIWRLMGINMSEFESFNLVQNPELEK